MSRRNRDKKFGRHARKRFLILTDGVITERGYFENIKRLTRDSIKVVARGSKDVDALVEMAIGMKLRSDYDCVAVICDIDQRLYDEKSRRTLVGAMKQAESADVMICLSHESFEIWLLAHLGEVKSEAGNRARAHELALQCGIVKGRKGKEIVPEKITRKSIEEALMEAERLRKTYGSDILKSSPLTDVDRVVRLMRFE